MSPWIKRALVAGGFGIGHSSSRIPQEIAAVVPYHDCESPSEFDQRRDIESTEDIKKSPSPSPSTHGFANVISSDTPFFHIDLAGAVAAAESGVGRFASFSS
ncbi:hypothetical protein CVT24_001615 [Panaeolus cyanescens]|uniref:Uncharacterized protein n=1 Tax=Panaeolus cyanescens TaxID=181874 RepID=A0A409W3F9_9AGAR|nr:hypothetical protein CVT24_001615 [Panaeolus cyanescens]